MKLQEKYKQPIPDGYAVEFPEGSGIYHIPILRVKEMLIEDFESHKFYDFHFEYLQRGHDCILSGSIVLMVDDKDCGVHTFTGGANFNLKKYADNQHFIPTLKSECQKNAVKDIGEKYGFYLNASMIDIQTLREIESGNLDGAVKPKKNQPSVGKAVSNILKSQEQKS